MKLKANSWKFGAAGFLVASLVVAVSNVSTVMAQGGAKKFILPTLSDTAKAGRTAYNRTCVKCHGRNGLGTGKGPPLIHDVYNPGHHGDAAFYRAVKRGSRQHHWRFGNMPPQPNVIDKQVAAIIRYIRELQTANGIVSRKHRM